MTKTKPAALLPSMTLLLPLNGDECAKLPQPCMRVRCDKVENLSPNLRMGSRGVAGGLCVDQRPRAAR